MFHNHAFRQRGPHRGLLEVSIEAQFPKNEYPAFTIVYRPLNNTEEEKPPIVHYAPLSIDQVTNSRESPWAITISEQEIQTIDPYDAETGETLLWKLALWGSLSSTCYTLQE